MSLTFYKTIAAIIILIISLLMVIYPIRAKSKHFHSRILELGEGFASGIFLGAALFHMLPDARYYFLQVYPDLQFPVAEAFCALGFILLLLLEEITLTLTAGRHAGKTVIAYLLTLILSVHALIEGTALGINTSLAAALIIFIAIIAHKGSESFALCVVLMRSPLKTSRILLLGLLFSLMTPLGISFGTTLTAYLHVRDGLLLTAAFTAFAAGTFLYLSTLHHMGHQHTHQHDHVHDEHHRLPELFTLVLGLTVMGIVAYWA